MSKWKIAYTFDEAAAQSGFSLPTLTQHIAEGRLLARFANNESAIRHEDLAAWLDALPTCPIGGAIPEPTPTGPNEAAVELSQTVTAEHNFRSPDDVAPELGMTKTELRRYCKESGHYTKLSMRRVMLDAENITALVAWVKTRDAPVAETGEKDPFA
ncbi:hypothetical protein ART_0150 [Arthrobacter sp. PAMC 25486]|uniref:helix-turn-helix domain-containing protein n=1 Tax=Arthrobacter sp. PAMC 25486 TaxID=1494608 RepID=UPI0005363101|nr:helix-turn-helix domain-containing protein [Arthrobacter sp. PAMC 25486]AIX99748.1 hypothetical protein ART_0150 [Arthrobacter sp. PAMC 25486]